LGIDDITPLYEIKDKTIKADKHLLNHVLLIECKDGQAMTSGTNAPNGVIVRYFSRRNLQIKLQF
jgi:hypothetical protein